MKTTPAPARALLLAAAFLAAASCIDPEDLGNDPAVITPDAGRTYPASELFGPCLVDSQCPGVGAFCRKASTTGLAGGVCTMPCTDRTFCNDSTGNWNFCLPDETGRTICQQKCLNGIDCSRDAYTCSPKISGTAAGLCYSICTTDAQCGEGAACNAASGKCVAAGALPKNKAAIGGKCSKNDDCASANCRTEVLDGVPTGWVEGMCLGPCIIPQGWNNNTVFNGDELPAGSCDDDAVCYPTRSYGKGEPGVCRPACYQDSDCREGYECLLEFSAKTFTRGFCVRMDCTDKECPSGYLCKVTDAGYVCARDP